MATAAMLLWGALAGYFAAGAFAATAFAAGRALERAMLLALATAVVLHAGALAARWAAVGEGPFITMHEILSSNVWSLALAYTACAWRWPVLRPASAVVMPLLVVMIAWLLVTDAAPGHTPATYRTVWLFVHVGFGKVFLGCALAAVGLAGVILLRATRMGRARFATLPDDAKLERLAFRFMAVAFLFETLMLLAGAVWAQDAWGRYWAWDPLETWAFLTWVALAGFLHARAAMDLSPRARAILVLAVFALAFLTFFGVPFVSTAPHKGAI